MQQTNFLPSLQGGELPGFGSSNGRSSGERSSNQITEVRLVPPEFTGGKVLWANGQEGYFMSMTGSKIKPAHGPSHRKKGRKDNNGKRGLTHPKMRHFGGAIAHRLMAATYAEEPCPIFFDSKGNPYKGIVHHVIENPYDLRVDNLLWWLSYKEHHIADVRRRKLEKILPDMYAVPTVELKRLQDPRRVDETTFNVELQKLAETYGTQNHL